MLGLSRSGHPLSSQGWRALESAPNEVQPWAVDPSSAARVAVRSRRIALRRNIYRCRVAALLVCGVMVGAFAADRPVAGVLASALAFIVLRCAAEARAEL